MIKVPEFDSLDIISPDMKARRTAVYNYNIGYEAGLRAGLAQAAADGSMSRADQICDAYSVQVSAKLIERMRGCRCLECNAMVSLVADEGAK